MGVFSQLPLEVINRILYELHDVHHLSTKAYPEAWLNLSLTCKDLHRHMCSLMYSVDLVVEPATSSPNDYTRLRLEYSDARPTLRIARLDNDKPSQWAKFHNFPFHRLSSVTLELSAPSLKQEMDVYYFRRSARTLGVLLTRHSDNPSLHSRRIRVRIFEKDEDEEAKENAEHPQRAYKLRLGSCISDDPLSAEEATDAELVKWANPFDCKWEMFLALIPLSRKGLTFELLLKPEGTMKRFIFPQNCLRTEKRILLYGTFLFYQEPASKKITLEIKEAFQIFRHF